MEKSPDGAMLSIPLAGRPCPCPAGDRGGDLAVRGQRSVAVSRFRRSGADRVVRGAAHAGRSGVQPRGRHARVPLRVDGERRPAARRGRREGETRLVGDPVHVQPDGRLDQGIGGDRSPAYWGLHLREPVRFAEGMERILRMPDQILLEVGPGQIMTSLARMHDACDPAKILISSMRHPKAEVSDAAVLMGALGRLWTAGVRVGLAGLLPGRVAPPRDAAHVPIPAAALLDRPGRQAGRTCAGSLGPRRNIADWYYTRSWRRTSLSGDRPSAASDRSAETRCVVFADGSDFARRCVERLRPTAGGCSR